MGLNSEGNDDSCQLHSISANPVDYYGIWYPKNSPETVETERLPLVVTDVKEVTAILKKCKGSRFKRVKTHEEALAFAQSLPSQIMSPCVSSPALKKIVGEDIEKGSAFRSLKPQEFCKLRAAIESGDADYFRQAVWSNPRYLIGNADNPTIMHEGTRYNALHVVAKSRQAAMCRLVLQTVEDPKFMQLMYNDDNPSDNAIRIKYLVDLYLNMRDKALNETPLHIAAKFGAADVVSILAAHPACDRYPKNKYGETPKEVALSRCYAKTVTSELKKAMAEAFEDKYFVAILVNNDSSAPPYISEPMSPTNRKQTVEEMIAVSRQSPLFGSPEMRACAGPMSEGVAKEYHEYLKSSNQRDSPLLLRSIRLSDMEKGYERIGRSKAKEMKIGWAENWEFLSDFLDISSPKGLKKLEDYLRSKCNDLTCKTRDVCCTSFREDQLNNTLNSPELTRLSEQFEKALTLSTPGSNGSVVWQSRTLEKDHQHDGKSTFESNDFISRMVKDIARLLTRELREQFENGTNLTLDFVSDLLPHFECLQLNMEKEQLETVWRTIAELMKEDLKEEIDSFKINYIVSLAESHHCSEFDEEVGHRQLPNEMCSRSKMLDVCQHVRCILKQLHRFLEMEKPSLARIGSETQDHFEIDEFYTPPMSPCSRSSSPSDDEYQSPTEGVAVFINGLFPSKIDLDVLRALNDTNIDPWLYPYVYQWKYLVNSYTQEETERWKTPMKRTNIRFPVSPIPLRSFKLV